ncbi:P-loop containing nucleoside triphosphate hydrolase protein [Apiosordaria backusii]|uniref:P-loop containing nucleoside triphosphate hydrolase protein n=1 Tax=Apiosordaria backusii TaxID=314023 RepID=A0AA40AAP2_9PEZI|nr:P-loop containing nucleoside triphosphate hydrolase protein [Apiosordaria backusii]
MEHGIFPDRFGKFSPSFFSQAQRRREQSQQQSSGGGPPDDSTDRTTAKFFSHTSAARISTDSVIAASLKRQYPSLQLTTVPADNVNILAYASGVPDDVASFHQVEPESSALPADLKWNYYLPPARRLDGSKGGIVTDLHFGKFLYRYKGAEFIVYLAEGRDGASYYPPLLNYYILSSPPELHLVESLLLTAGHSTFELKDEIWVFDGGWWQKSRELYESVQKSSWDNVILDEDMKKALIDDHTSFFASRGQYERLKVPWKRGLIYWGPPGNGKTISIKAMMKTLSDREEKVPSLYVRNFVSFGGPEYAISLIFSKARQYAPCYLIFEDLDSLVTDGVRSYFLNEIDGLKSNDGIFIVGSTNHLERLDPGLSKRPSRFDRKYFFPDPNLDQRVAYCKFWQGKLKSNKDLDFPDKLCKAIAEITDGFSFAYIQEAFVAALLVIARDSNAFDVASALEEAGAEDDWVSVDAPDSDDDDDDTDLEKLVLWVEIKKQIEILRQGMGEERQNHILRRRVRFD